MTDTHASFRAATGPELADALRAARDYTLLLFSHLTAAGYADSRALPLIQTINPPLWEIGHTAWFAEWYILREALSSQPGAANGRSLLAQGDELFDSNMVAHDTRWSLPLPAPDALLAYCGEVLERSLERLARAVEDDEALYPYRLALAHEDMHGEALLYTLQTLGVAAPEAMLAPPPPAAGGELACSGGEFRLGGVQRGGFVFDNEKPAPVVAVAPFRIDAGLVSNAQYTAFVDDGGYQDRRCWSDAGWRWLEGQGRCAPRYWQRQDGQWLARRFGTLQALAPAEPVRHLSLHEAQAYCAWVGRRLPSEAEWEFAATTEPAFGWGALWEWTASPFAPHPGFAPDRYREYSAPWFHTHQVLRGASFATPERLRSPYFRNFYQAQRDDIFAGFRTCRV